MNNLLSIGEGAYNADGIVDDKLSRMRKKQRIPRSGLSKKQKRSIWHRLIGI